MKYRSILFVAITIISPFGFASTTDDVDIGNLVLVEENHAKVTSNDVPYILDSYIIMFQQPYYIKVAREDSKPIELDEAVKVAEEYIKPRGCTEPLSRRKDLDKVNSNKSQWIIGVEC